MCGIVGALSFSQSNYLISEPYITRMRDSMLHRGPDGEGNWISPDKQVGFGHRRLSIIDLSEKANQPMSNKDGSLQLVFNGEIYNHKEIRKELNGIRRFKWKTDHSDTEVIVHAFEEWGIDCVHRFRGVFAFAIWNTKSRELWLVRDRIGVKPLYYSIHNGRLTFASEIKALLKDPDQRKKINEESFFNYLSFLTSPAPQTLFEGINKLPGGTWMRINEHGHIREHRYWDVLDHTISLESVSEQEICEQVLTELRTAVNIRKISDVPVGVFLSGGIDSSTNAALFSENGDEIKTFTIGYDQEYASYQNEMEYARFMANEVKAIYHEKILSINDLIEFLPQMVYLQDEPIADPVCVPVYYLSKLAKDNNVTVCQVGEGADELFIGYDSWIKRLQVQKFDDLPFPRKFKKIAVHLLDGLGMKGSFKREFMRRGSCNEPIFWSGAEVFTQYEKEQLLSKRMRGKFKGSTSWESLIPIHNRFLEKHPTHSWIDWMSYVDLNFRLPELLLMRLDKMSMGNSLEGRLPFLDHKFVELSMSIPASYKIQKGSLKHMLKRSLRGTIPDQLIDRKKMGFGAPIKEWFEMELGSLAFNELKEFCNETDLLNWETVRKTLEGNDKSRAWTLLNVAKWWSTYIR
ncbi:MAG: asparagine synthase (glutamine-hydrolyzing) [Nitrospina sp.]|nr:asparagine synthase (glutamine-hydrolyzing) [Nitrospina sp.]